METKEKLIDRIMKVTKSNDKHFDRLCEQTPQYLKLLLRTIENLKK